MTTPQSLPLEIPQRLGYNGLGVTRRVLGSQDTRQTLNRPIAVLPFVFLLALAPEARAVSWLVPSQCPTIQSGIDSASAGDTVLVSCGTYYAHDIVVKPGITLASDTGNADCVTIDAEHRGRVFFCENIEPASTIHGMSLVRGADDKGGALYCTRSSLLISDCVLKNNSCGHRGGGIHCVYSSLVVKGCTLTNNDSWEPGGGAYCFGSSATFERCIIAGNSASFYGGGIACDSVTLLECSISENSALVGDIFDGYGGGVLCGRASITDCVFSGNSACFLGGGLVCGAAVIEDCVFSGNLSSCGGGAVACMEPAQFTNCTFFGNDAAWRGAAVYFGDYCGEKGLDHYPYSEVWGGDRPSAAHRSDSGPVFENCIIAFNLASEPVSCSPYGGTEVPVVTCCNIYGNGSGDWVGCIADQEGTDGNLSEDPLFCDREGGDFHLDSASPCAGDANPECGQIGALGMACGSLPPVLALEVFQDACLTQDLDIHLLSSEQIDTTSFLVRVGADTVRMRCTDETKLAWVGEYTLTESADSIWIDVRACDLDGHEARLTVDFSATFVPAARGGLVKSPDGNLRLTIGPRALERDAFALVFSGDAFVPDSALAGSGPPARHIPTASDSVSRRSRYRLSPEGILAGSPALLELSYGGTTLEDEPPDRIYLERKGSGRLESYVDPERRIVSTGISDMGTYGLSLGREGSSRLVDPRFLELRQNFPNPFHRSTSIRFEIRSAQHVRVSIYDVTGRLVAEPLSRFLPPGSHQVTWDGLTRHVDPAAAGVYLCRVQSDRWTSTNKMLLVR